MSALCSHVVDHALVQAMPILNDTPSQLVHIFGCKSNTFSRSRKVVALTLMEVGAQN